MATSYHTHTDDPDDVRAGLPSDAQVFHEPKVEALPLSKPVRPTFFSQTGLMAQIIVEAEELPNDHEHALIVPVALLEQETTMSNNNLVMIIEDTVELAEVIEATVEAMGMPAVVANHGSIALEQLQTTSPRLLLLDLSLPDISGWEILKTARELFKVRQLPMPLVIVITALDDPANRLVGKLEEVDAYLIKPFTPQKIEEIINSVLNAQA